MGSRVLDKYTSSCLELLQKISDKELTKEIQKQAEEGNSFAFLNDEEELYSIEDLKEAK